MKWYCGTLAVIGTFLVSLSSCKKPGETLKADLGEAGYKLTAEDWFRASRLDDVTALKKFAVAGFAADVRDSTGDSALHAAAAAGARNSADHLLNRGLAVDLRGAGDRTPLMAAVLADQTEMVRWLLRQGADPRLQDKEGFKPLMLAVREGKPGSVGELAPYDRAELDSALLLAALVGRADVIDALTNYGASVYARMADGRTPLMVAAENGHAEAVKLLLDIGASRYTSDSEGRTAADIASAAGHAEVAALISRDPRPDDLALDSEGEIAEAMDSYVAAATAKAKAEAIAPSGRVSPQTKRSASESIEGATLSRAVVGSQPGRNAAGDPAADRVEFSMPPLVMRHYREKEVPIRIRTVQGETATLALAGKSKREVNLRAGDPIPGSNLVVLRVRRRMEDSKVSLGKPSEISTVEVRDRSTGKMREWISGVPSSAHDPVALVEDEATGRRYIAAPGQRFKAADGAEYLISDVRPNQMVIQHVASGGVRTIPLRGPGG